MRHLSLAARYRPQTFAGVVGQQMATTALSRAAAESRVAPAYLLSGTRGVGKTTIARIFAKALNCANGPAAEPCNACPQCLHITSGNHVDVREIDGASNTGVDDVRALRENLGFSPMEGKYKIFIVDEAHMLSKSAFNALLKTLEEPPPRVVFIFATTEAHRFPATIVSRCQHFVFRHLSEGQIEAHLQDILAREGIKYDAEAARLIARRAAGSVRDSLSLLDQVLALGGGDLTAQITRDALGLAGSEFYEKLFGAIAAGDCAAVIDLCRQILENGVDIGFFIRELAEYLRNLFLFSQAGAAILPGLKLAPDEISFLKRQAPAFAAAQLHAAWQMVLEGQRAITQSVQPGPALELLLLNLALLPRLMPVGDVAAPAGVAEKAASEEAASTKEEGGPSRPEAEPSWEAFLDFCAREPAEDAPPRDILKSLQAEWRGNNLKISAPTTMLWDRLQRHRQLLQNALLRFCHGNAPELEFNQPRPRPTHAQMMEECANNPQVKLCREIFNGSITDCRPAAANTEREA